MLKIIASAATALCLASVPAQAFDLGDMTTDERAAFRSEIRAYLLDNPEVIMEAVALLERRESESAAAHDLALVQANAQDIFSDGYSWVGGNLDGDITLVEFVDYRCGYCRKAHAEVQKLVAADGNIRLIYKEFPILGEASLLSSRFAIAVKQIAGDDAYEGVHDALITFKGDITPTALTRLADSMGLDATAILDKMNDPSVTDEIQKTRALAGELKISGTPTFVMKDQLLRGYLPLESMTALVAEKRAR